MSATPVAEEIVYYNDMRYESREGTKIPVSSISVTDKRVVGGGYTISTERIEAVKYIRWFDSTDARDTRRLLWVGFAGILGFGALDWLGINFGLSIVPLLLVIVGFVCMIVSASTIYSRRKEAAVRVFASGTGHDIILDMEKAQLTQQAIEYAIGGLEPPPLPKGMNHGGT